LAGNVTGVRGDDGNLDDSTACSITVKREKKGADRRPVRDAPATGDASHWARLPSSISQMADLRHEYARHAVCGSAGVAAVQRGGSIFMTGSSCFGERFSCYECIRTKKAGVAIIARTGSTN